MFRNIVSSFPDSLIAKPTVAATRAPAIEISKPALAAA